MRNPPRPLVIRNPHLLTVALGVAAALRGTSLLVRPVDSVSLLITTRFVPIQAWGAGFLTVAALLLTAAVASPLRFTAHAAAFAVYLLYSLSLLAAAVWFGAPWSTFGGLAVVLTLHVALMATYAPRPPAGVVDDG